MLEYQGWFVIRESYNEEEESEAGLDRIWENIKVYVENINETRKAEVCHLSVINNDYKLTIAGLDNHKSSSWTELLEFFNWIAIEARGSYGLLYFYDDEDKNGLNNQFQVLVLKKGKINFEIDSFLSPYIPEVEE